MNATLTAGATYPVAEPSHRHRTAKFTGEVRPVKRGEWFLSGAIIEAYFANADLSTPAPIAVLTRKAKDAVPTYEGWRNRATWNVALHVNNDYGLYTAACDYVRQRKANGQRPTWSGFVAYAGLSGQRTMDRYAYDGKALDRAELSAMLRELVD